MTRLRTPRPLLPTPPRPGPDPGPPCPPETPAQGRGVAHRSAPGHGKRAGAFAAENAPVERFPPRKGAGPLLTLAKSPIPIYIPPHTPLYKGRPT